MSRFGFPFYDAAASWTPFKESGTRESYISATAEELEECGLTSEKFGEKSKIGRRHKRMLFLNTFLLDIASYFEVGYIFYVSTFLGPGLFIFVFWGHLSLSNYRGLPAKPNFMSLLKIQVTAIVFEHSNSLTLSSTHVARA